MTSVRAAPRAPGPDTPPAPVEFRYAQTDGFVALLRELGASLLVGPYQANKLLAVRADGAGLSTLIRPTSAMDGVPLAERRDELRCGVTAVDLRSGRVVGTLEFETAVEEIFDVLLLPGVRFPEVVGFQKEDVHHTFVVPPAAGP